jgi:hypothetical protein
MAIYNLTFDAGTSVASGTVGDLGFLVFNSANNHTSLYASITDIPNGIPPVEISTEAVWNETAQTFTIVSSGVLNDIVISKLNDVWSITYPIPLPPQNIDPLLTADFRITNPDGSKEFLSKLTKVTGTEHQVEVTVTNGAVNIGIDPAIFEGLTPDIQNINNNSVNTGSLTSRGNASIAGDLNANIVKAVHSIQIGEYVLTAGKLSDLLN